MPSVTAFAVLVMFMLAGSGHQPEQRLIPVPDKATCEAVVTKLYQNPPPADKVTDFQAGCVELRAPAKGV